jgi:maltooligosyltrehalose trehalohydrolase
MAVANLRRRLFAGVELQSDATVHARVWAPACRTVDFALESEGDRAFQPLERDADGFFSGILDVVYNHFGPDGNDVAEFAPEYFTDKYGNDWGATINFDGPAAVREFFLGNAGCWIDEFHVDGLRLDATQDIHDASRDHIVAAIARRAREAAGPRRVYLAENEPQDTRLVRPPAAGGFGLDAVWNDDFHHTAVVALTGRREAYYTDYRGSGQELLSCAKYGYLYQGQWYRWQNKPRGTPAFDLPASAFIAYLENHDQVANSASGRRLHEKASPAR